MINSKIIPLGIGLIVFIIAVLLAKNKIKGVLLAILMGPLSFILYSLKKKRNNN